MATTPITEQKVLVTGGTGFVGIYCVLQLLQAGYQVRTTIRSMQRKEEVLDMLKTGGIENPDNLSFYAADLFSNDGWQEAISGCDYVLHVASPFPPRMPENEDDLIIPAREGALRVLRLAQQEGVKRVVLTSSYGAVGFGHPRTTRVFNEKDWTNLNGEGVSAYIKSKTLAEQAAWEYIRNSGGKLELSVINPVGIYGPLLSTKHLSSSVLVVKQLLDGSLKACPKKYFNAVDVRDVAGLHIIAMTHPQAAGERFLALAGKCLSLYDAAMILKNHFGNKAKNVPVKEIPNWQFRLKALFDKQLRPQLPEIGRIKNVSNEKAKTLLGWAPKSNEEAIIASAESLLPV